MNAVHLRAHRLLKAAAKNDKQNIHKNMLDNLNDFHIVLASNSPRRRELLAGLGIAFDVRVLPGVDESYPASLPAHEIPLYIATAKAEANRKAMNDGDIVITADTVVICGGSVLGKPADADEARSMLTLLSGKTHQVVTGVCLTSRERQRKFAVTTGVTFKELTPEEIDYYIENFRPYDKAGAYGIQEWIGYIGVTGISGSFFNVMGLPVQRVYNELQMFKKA